MRIRAGRIEDLPRLLEIYNHYVEHTHITFDTTALSLETRRHWFDAFSMAGPHRLFVAESNGQVDGYVSSREFRIKPAYLRSIEMSIYLSPEACGAGVGTALYARLIEALGETAMIHRAYAGITLPNEVSIALHQRFGFKRVGTYTEVGFKFGRYWDVTWFERAL